MVVWNSSNGGIDTECKIGRVLKKGNVENDCIEESAHCMRRFKALNAVLQFKKQRTVCEWVLYSNAKKR